ncbi:MAG: hypothetical protein OQK94_05690 [Gammaproteobacteria bacterium]|nr:hypothetical protein [Gammaproteobacteria bacterium]MCW8994072.1 hypothetical protein [Gammaproteobacteria bacterium]
MEPVESFFPVSGLNLTALAWPGKGIPPIALHGWFDIAASFRPLAPYLKEEKVCSLSN